MNDLIRARLRRDVEDARRAFRARARAVLRQAYEDADSVSTAVGDASVDEVFRAWADHLIATLQAEE